MRTGSPADADPRLHEHTHSHTAPDGTVHVHSHTHAHVPGHTHHSVAEIRGFIERSALSAQGKVRAVRMIHRLAEAEACIHQMPVEQVHLHEVGELDSIIDIVGAVSELTAVRISPI